MLPPPRHYQFGISENNAEIDKFKEPTIQADDPQHNVLTALRRVYSPKMVV